MAKQSSNDGCGLLLVAGLLVFAISKCSGSSEERVLPVDPATSFTTEAEPQADTESTIKMYVIARKMNCRTDASANGAVVKQFDHGDAVDAGEARNGWLAIGQATEERCWAKASLLSEEQPEPLMVEAAPVPLRAFGAPALDTGFSCGGKSVCRQMNSCDEAYHYLNQCGVGRLDGDGDGVPCESIC